MSYLHSFTGGALQLFRQGYHIAPLIEGYRYPKGIKGWNAPGLTEEKVQEWAEEHTTAGIVLVTGEVIAVDIDVYNPEYVANLVEWGVKNIGVSPIRIGKSPKCCLFYRAEHPIAFSKTSVYEDFIGNLNAIEILGKGHAISIYGKYHDPLENTYYKWGPDEDGLLNIPLKELESINIEQIKALLDYFEKEIPSDWINKSNRHEGNLREICGKSAGNLAESSLEHMSNYLNHIEKVKDFTVDMWKDALSHIDPNCDRETWVRIGMGISQEFDNSKIGFAVWYEWSCGSEKSALVMGWDVLWKSFIHVPKINPHTGKISKPVTGKLIIKLAEQRGWRNPNKDPSKVVNPEIRKNAYQLVSNPKNIDDFLSRFVFMVKDAQVCDLLKPPHLCICTYSEFKISYAACKTLVNNGDKTALVSTVKLWIDHPDRMTAEGEAYLPGESFQCQDDFGLNWINTFRFPQHKDEIDTKGLEPFFEHMRYLFPYDEEREWFINWMAHKIQKPHIKQKVTPLHISVEQGTGRGWVGELLIKLLGHWNCSKTTVKQLAGKGTVFEDYINNKLLCIVDEVGDGKRYELSYKIRSLLTDEYQSVNVKSGSFSTKRIYTDFWLQSNLRQAIAIEETDRRTNVLSGPSTVRGYEYYNEIYEWLGTCNVGALFYWLLKKDLSRYNWTRPLQTQAREELILDSRSELEQLLIDYLEEPEKKKKVMTLEDIESDLQTMSLAENRNVDINRPHLIRVVSKRLRRLPQMMVGGVRKRFWITDKNFNPDLKNVKNYLNSIGVNYD